MGCDRGYYFRVIVARFGSSKVNDREASIVCFGTACRDLWAPAVYSFDLAIGVNGVVVQPH